MRMPWTQSKSEIASRASLHQADFFEPKATATGEPLLVSVELLEEDPANPRTEFPDAEIDELAEDIRQRGILQPVVVRPADGTGHYRIHFGAKRFRAAHRAGLMEVPVVVRAPRRPIPMRKWRRTRSATACRRSTWRDSSEAAAKRATPTRPSPSASA